ncbi:MAG: hypothetical protein WC248_02710 [Candidatus Methanomethylophilaceae archaeon]|jgi:hypothetical protein
MGIMDKIKGVFNKKDKAPGVKKVKSVGGRAAQFNGSGKVAESLKFAAAKIDVQVAAKKYDDKRADMFMAQLKGVEASGATEDAKLVQISQIIGGIIAG